MAEEAADVEVQGEAAADAPLGAETDPTAGVHVLAVDRLRGVAVEALRVRPRAAAAGERVDLEAVVRVEEEQHVDRERDLEAVEAVVVVAAEEARPDVD